MELKNVVLVDGARSAFGRGARGGLVAARLDEVGATILRALLDRHPKVADRMIEDVGVGNVGPGRSEFSYLGNIQRLAGLRSAASTRTASAARAWRRCTASPWRS